MTHTASYTNHRAKPLSPAALFHLVRPGLTADTIANVTYENAKINRQPPLQGLHFLELKILNPSLRDCAQQQIHACLVDFVIGEYTQT